MGYQFFGGSGTESMVTGHFTGRCPLTGRFMSGAEFGDDEPVEHHFGLVYDPAEIQPEEADDDLDIVTDYGDDAGWNLSADEEKEFEMLNLRHRTNYWHPKDLMTLRRLDGLRWVEKTYGWCRYGAPETKTLVPGRQMGSSGFGAGEKARVNLYDFDWLWARRGIGDQGKKCRKARLKRTLREVRARVRSRDEYNTWLHNERKVEVRVDSGYWSLWDDFILAEPDVTIDASFGWSTDYVRFVHTSVSKSLLAEWAEYDSSIWDFYQVVADEEDMLEALLDQSIDYGTRHHAYEDSFGDDYGFYPDDSSCDDDYDEFEVAERLEAAYWNEMFISPEDIDDMIERQEAEEERLLETLSISHSGGGRGTKAVKAVERNLCRPHHYLEVA